MLRSAPEASEGGWWFGGSPGFSEPMAYTASGGSICFRCMVVNCETIVSLRYLPIAEATVIAFLLPYFTCWACSIILHDPFTRKAQLAGIVSFLGVILIAHPTSFFAKSPDGPPGPSPQTTSVTPSQRLLGVMMGLAGAVFGAGAYTTIRYIGKRAHPLISVTYYSLMCTVVTMILLIFIPGIGFQLPANLRQWGLLISLGVFGFLLQFLMTAGLQLDNSNRVMNMLYIQIVFALALDKLIWGTLPDWMSIAGGILVLTSTIYAAMQKSAATVVTTSEVASEEELGLMQSLDHDDDVANDEESLATGVDEDI
ncbi:hypothetical protein MMC08_003283 [Hypocenomyce scalaris]|nr:hypothetical protein [Hypocenomyce scalaris]